MKSNKIKKENKSQIALNWLLFSMKVGKTYELTKDQKPYILDILWSFVMPMEKTKGYEYFFELNNDQTTIVKHTFNYWDWIRKMDEHESPIIKELINIKAEAAKQMKIKFTR